VLGNIKPGQTKSVQQPAPKPESPPATPK